MFTLQKLGKIIERDYFPEIENLRDKLDYLEAQKTNDIPRLELFRQKYSGRNRSNGEAPSQTPPDSPATFDTPEPCARLRLQPPPQDDDTQSVISSVR